MNSFQLVNHWMDGHAFYAYVNFFRLLPIIFVLNHMSHLLHETCEPIVNFISSDIVVCEQNKMKPAKPRFPCYLRRLVLPAHSNCEFSPEMARPLTLPLRCKLKRLWMRRIVKLATQMLMDQMKIIKIRTRTPHPHRCAQTHQHTHKCTDCSGKMK